MWSLNLEFDSPYLLKFSPDRRWLLVGSNSFEEDSQGSVTLWDIQEIMKLESGISPAIELKVPPVLESLGIDDATFSAKGGLVAVAAQTETGLWRLDGRNAHKVMAAPYAPASIDWREAQEKVVFSPDARYLARGTRHNLVWVWETANGRQVARLDHDGPVQYVAFSPDSGWLATVANDYTARVWNFETGEEIVRIQLSNLSNNLPVNIAFTPEGRYVVTSEQRYKGEEREILHHRWPWRAQDLISELCARLTRNLTPGEWRQYFGDQPYRQTCPNLPTGRD